MYRVSRESHLEIGYLFRKWEEAQSKDDLKKLKEKYTRTPEVSTSKDMKRRQRHIGEAVILLDKIIDIDGNNPDNINFNNAMTYMWVAVNCEKYFLDAEHARADYGIPDLVKVYVKDK